MTTPSLVRDCALALGRDHGRKLSEIIAFVRAYCRSEIRERGEWWAVREVLTAVHEVREPSRRRPTKHRASAAPLSAPAEGARVSPFPCAASPVGNLPGVSNGAGRFFVRSP